MAKTSFARFPIEKTLYRTINSNSGYTKITNHNTTKSPPCCRHTTYRIVARTRHAHVTISLSSPHLIIHKVMVKTQPAARPGRLLQKPKPGQNRPGTCPSQPPPSRRRRPSPTDARCRRSRRARSGRTTRSRRIRPNTADAEGEKGKVRGGAAAAPTRGRGALKGSRGSPWCHRSADYGAVRAGLLRCSGRQGRGRRNRCG